MLLRWFRLSRLQLKVIVHQKIRKHHFDLGTREEPSRTRPNAMAKVDVINASCGVLILQLIALDFPELGEAKWIKLPRIWVQL